MKKFILSILIILFLVAPADSRIRGIMGGAVDGTPNPNPISTCWNISTAVFLQSRDIFPQTTLPIGIFVKPDGTKLYVVGNNRVHEYDLSTAWDISSAVFLQSLTITVLRTSPHGISFKTDGTKMYLTASAADDVDEYDLSGAWNISTAVFLQSRGPNFVTNPNEIFFKPDGTKLYILAATNVLEHNLSTPWDISTAVFLKLFSVTIQDSGPQGLFFRDDGFKMYVSGSTNDNVYEYDLSTAWDVSTANFLQLFSVAIQDSLPRGIFFKPDGAKMYVVGDTTDFVYEYDLCP